MIKILYEIFTKVECENVLRKYCEPEGADVIAYKVKPLSDKVQGFMGQHYLLEITFSIPKSGNNEIQGFFLKVLNGTSKLILEMCMSVRAYEKEEFHYNFLQREYLKENIDISYGPRLYFCKPYKLVLEDLCLRGFTTRNKYDQFSLDECKVVLKNLATFHSSFIIYEKRKSVCLLDSYPECLEDRIFTTEVTCGSTWIRCSIDGLVKIVDHIDIISELEKNTLKSDIMEVYQKTCDKQVNRKCLNTILHADLWSNNFLFKYKDGKVTDCMLLDYQAIKYGPPASDVMQMIRTNTNSKFRQDNLNDLLKFYYECLSTCLSKAGYSCENYFTMNDFLDSCKEVDLDVTLQSIAGRSMTFLSEDVIAEYVATEEANRKFMFEDRSKVMVNSFLTSDLCREVLLDDLMDFKNTVSKYKHL
ncbi:PREDICTED: uncharacterized protein LOC108563444 [Nicrophorus vespilloides]|uniref:Uncharacterized protein LOC108563444 n=1 Tax=Nicrophorus vespilloides TaxID=110193 RepID=A0ABM1MSU5_NICVS|nr:PREDICTED: uncharacterized protein LOC108563444 [Nicrophorus vespilloides]